MNRCNFKNRFVLLLGFSLFYIQAAGTDPIENQPSVKNEQEAGNKNEQTADPRPMGAFIPNAKNTLEKSNVLKKQEPLPPSPQLYTQPAEGLRFTTKNAQLASQKNNTHVTTGVVSTKKTIRKDVDESLIEEIVNKYTNGFPRNAVETKILKDNINELRIETTSFTRRPSISDQRQLSRNARD